MNPNMHTENVSDDGAITDGGELSVATYYSPCVGIMNADGYLRVVSDARGYLTETRVAYATLINAGWTPPATSPDNQIYGASRIDQDDYLPGDIMIEEPTPPTPIELEDRGPDRDHVVHYGPRTFLPTLSFEEFCALPEHSQKSNIEHPGQIFMREAGRLGGLIGTALDRCEMTPERLRQIVIVMASLYPEPFSWVRQTGAWDDLQEWDWAGEIDALLKNSEFSWRLQNQIYESQKR